MFFNLKIKISLNPTENQLYINERSVLISKSLNEYF